MLRSLPKRFDYKVTAIEEAKDISSMKLDELIGSLRTFEMRLKDSGTTSKEIAFSVESSKESVGATSHKEILESMALMTKTFTRVLRKFNKKGGADGNSSKEMHHKKRSDGFQNRNKKIQCHECQGFGHIEAECANTLMK